MYSIVYIIAFLSTVTLSTSLSSTKQTTLLSTPPTTTLSPDEKHRLWCDSYFAEWTPNTTFCIRTTINRTCHLDGMNLTNEYLRCKSILQKEISSYVSQYNSVYLLTYMRFYAKTMVTQFLIERERDKKLKSSQKNREERMVYSNFIWITGFRFRYADMKWPNYENGFKRRRWNKRNDSIYVPYGSLPRGEYQYRFALYDSLWFGNLTKYLVRLKTEWPIEHNIYTGEFIDYTREAGLYFKPTQQINSAVIQAYVFPVVKNPLPGKIEISFMHLDRNMNNPVCVYWQLIEDFHPEIVPPHGYWTNYGMSVKSTNKSMTVCQASHYGAYALLMEPIRPIPSKPMSTLDLLTVILSVIAIVMLFGFIVSMVMLDCLSIHSRVYVYIALSMAFAHLFFLVGFFTRNEFDNCTTMMTLMELSFMFVVTWFLVDAIHQHSKISPLFNPNTNVSAFYFIIGVGLPLSVLIAMLEFPYPKFDKLAYCWPNIEGINNLYFVVPIAAVILVVGFLRVQTFGVIRKADKIQRQDVNYMRAILGIKAACVILSTVIIYLVLGTVGIKHEGDVRDAIQCLLPIIQIILSGQIIHYYFRKNDEVIDAVAEQKKILERIRMSKMDHLKGVAMDVKYVPGENDTVENAPSVVDIKRAMKKEFEMTPTWSRINTPDEHLRSTSKTNLIK